MVRTHSFNGNGQDDIQFQDGTGENLRRLLANDIRDFEGSGVRSPWSAGAWYRFGSHFRYYGSSKSLEHWNLRPFSAVPSLNRHGDGLRKHHVYGSRLVQEMTTKAVPSNRTPKAGAISSH